MRKIFAFLMTTVDGYYEGPNGEFDFWVTDDEFNTFAVEQLDEADTLLFGRVTYEGMAAYWPTPAGKEDDPEIAARMNGLAKIVVSRTWTRPSGPTRALSVATSPRSSPSSSTNPGRTLRSWAART
jgi:dihydrofolate reductase